MCKTLAHGEGLMCTWRNDMTEEQLKLLQSYGFHVEQDKIKHKKLGLEKNIEEFTPYTDIHDLRQYITELLRNQCVWKRSDS
jgi:dTDP-4-amino-4,6-dideoxygalactose transaminase